MARSFGVPSGASPSGGARRDFGIPAAPSGPAGPSPVKGGKAGGAIYAPGAITRGGVEAPPYVPPSPLIRRAYAPLYDPSRETGPALPNIQEVFRPLFRPREVGREQGIYVGSRKAYEALTPEQRRPYSQRRSLAAQVAYGAPSAAMEGLSRFSEVTRGAIGAGAQQAGVLPGVPLSEMQALNQGAINPTAPIGALLRRPLIEAASRSPTGRGLLQARSEVGRLAQRAGLTLVEAVLRGTADYMRSTQDLAGPPIGEVDPALVAEAAARREALRTFILRQASQVRDMDALLAPFDSHLVASMIASKRAAGQDTADLEATLVGMVGQQQAGSLLEAATTFHDVSGQDVADFFDPKAWAAATYTYASPQRVAEARTRLERGEPIDVVLSELNTQLTGAERTRDFLGLLVYDPLNIPGGELHRALGEVSGLARVAQRVQDIPVVGPVLRYAVAGPLTRDERLLLRSARRYAAAADEAAELAQFRRWMDVAPPSLVISEKLSIPEGLNLIRRTQQSRLHRVAEEALNLNDFLSRAIGDSPEATTALRAAGVKPGTSARLVALQLVAEPSLLDDWAAAAGMRADDFANALGIPRGSPVEIASYQLALDPLHSGPAVRARAMMAEANLESLARAMSEQVELRRALMLKPPGPRSLAEGRANFREMLSEIRQGRFRQAFSHLKTPAALARDEAQKAMAQVLGRWEEMALGVWGVGRRRPLPPIRLAQSAQQMVAAFFHMGLNPGWVVRNFGTDFQIAVGEGINRLTPTRTARQTLAEWDLLPVGLNREFTGRVDVAGPALNMFTIQREVEAASAAAATYQGANNVFGYYMRPGRFVPPTVTDELAARFGTERAAQVEAALRTVRTHADLNILPERLFRQGSPALTLGASDPALIDDATRMGVLADILEIKSSGLNDAARAQAYADLPGQMREMARQHRAPLPAPGTAAASDFDQGQLAAYSVFANRKFADEINQRIQQYIAVQNEAEREAMATLSSALEHALPNISDGARREELSRAANRLLIEQRAAGPAMEDFRLQVWDAFWANYWDQPQRMTPEIASLYAGAANRADAFYRARIGLNNAYWQRSQDSYAAMLDLAAQMGAPNPRSWQDVAAPMLERLRRVEGEVYLADLKRLQREAGVNDFQLLNRLKELQPDIFGDMKMGDFNRFLADPVNVTRDLSETIRRAIGQGGVADEIDPALREAAQQLTPDTDALPVGLPADEMAARAEDLEHLMARVAAEEQALAGQPSTWTRAEARQLRAITRQLRPRLSAVRQMASEVGVALRDLTLHNYGDKFVADNVASLLFNYSFWYSRNLARAAGALLRNPGYAAAWVKFRMAIRQANRAKGVSEFFQDQIPIGSAAGPIYLPFLAAVDPLNAFFADKFYDDEQRRTPTGEVISDLSNFGPGPMALIQFGMAFNAMRQGRADEADAWLSYLGGSTRFLRSASVLAREAGVQAIPPGGVALEPWLYDANGRATGPKWEMTRIGKVLYELVARGEVSREEMIYAGQFREGAAYERALQESAARTAKSYVLSYLFGAGLRARGESELEIERMDAEWRYYYLNRDDWSPEQRRAYVRALQEKYPYMDAVFLFRRDPDRRLEIVSWSVLNRLPPNNREILDAYGMGDTFDSLLAKFYDDGLRGMSEHERDLWRVFVEDMSVLLAFPADGTAQEWQGVWDRRAWMNDWLEGKYGPGIYAQQSHYMNLPENEKPPYLEAHPELELFWQDKDAIIADDPLLLKYYASTDTFEDQLYAERDAEIARRWPENEALWEEYRTIRAQDIDAGNDFFAAHPSLSEEMAYKTEFDLRWRERLDKMLSTTANLEEHFASLQDKALKAGGFETAGQADVAALLAEGSLARFDLPENLDERELVASINQELDGVTDEDWGAMRRFLDEQGNMDRVLDAFMEFRNMATAGVPENATELQALLVLLEQFNAGERPLAGAGGGGPSRPRRQAGGGGARRRSSRGGAVATEAQVEAAREAVGSFLATLQTTNPLWWAWLRRLTGMNAQQRAEFLSAHPDFARALASFPIPLAAVAAYLNTPPPARKSSPSGGASRPTSTRYSNPLL